MVDSEIGAMHYFAEALLKSVGDNDFSCCFLRIQRYSSMLRFGARWCDRNGNESSLDTSDDIEMCEVIETLYTITQTQTPIHADWNKAVFTLYPDGKVNMEYIWDAEWQAERDANKAKVQKELERRRKISESLRKKKTEQLMENDWAKAILAGKEVKVEIRAIFEGVSKRPSGFEIDYWINGIFGNNIFTN